METDYLQMLAQIVLPSQILDYFTIAGVERTATEIYIRLDEKMNPELANDTHFESKGFMDSVNVTDFPIRDHKVILRIRRRRWTRNGRSQAERRGLHPVPIRKWRRSQGTAHTLALSPVQVRR